MVRAVQVVYLVVLAGCVLAGFLVPDDVPWWKLALAGAAVMLPVAMADTAARRQAKRNQ